MASTKQFIIALALALGFIAASDLYPDDLHGAAKRGDTDAIRMLLATGADPNARAKYRLTPLHYAAGKGHTGATRALLAGGADPNASTKHKATPLHFAALKGHTDVIRALLAGGANPNASGYDGRTPLDLAVEEGHTEIQALLRTAMNEGTVIDGGQVQGEEGNTRGVGCTDVETALKGWRGSKDDHARFHCAAACIPGKTRKANCQILRNYTYPGQLAGHAERLCTYCD